MGDELRTEGDARASGASRPRFPVIAVGLGAGGVPPLVELLRAFQPGGSSLVVVTEPGGVCAGLADTMRRASRLEVEEIERGTPLLPDRIYLAPSELDLAVFHGVFHLVAPLTSARLPIDFFMRSLAAENGSSSLGMVLGAAGPDGTGGLEAIAAEGGLSVGGPERLAAELARLGAHGGELALRRRDRLRAEALRDRSDDLGDVGALGVLLEGARSLCGLDLADHKPATIRRRIEQRMIAHGFERVADYVAYARDRPAELGFLRKDRHGGPEFFHDSAAYAALEATILPRLVETKRPDSAVRVWVPECGSGADAYSLAICLVELVEARAPGVRVQIFAGDTDRALIREARRGFFPASIARDVPAPRLERHFVRETGGYRISHRVREVIVFGGHDVTRDPPFAHLDLVCCRDLLLHLRPERQKKAISILHHALNPDGVLWLGRAETIGDHADLFVILDGEHRFYRRRDRDAQVAEAAGADAAGARRRFIDAPGPPGLLVDDHLEVVQFRGQLGRYLEPSPGNATLQLMKLVRPELREELRGAVIQARLGDESSWLRRVGLRDGEVLRAVDVEIIPVGGSGAGRSLLVLFHEAGPDAPLRGHPSSGLEGELVVAHGSLQTTVEELESANEELKSSNDELQSTNEELQAVNGELETLKAELQLTNAELRGANEELHRRMGDLSQAQDDVENVLGAARDPILVVGLDLRLRRFTRAAAKLLGLGPKDIGRPLSDLRSFFGDLDLEALAVDAVDRLGEARLEVVGADGRRYAVGVATYKRARAIGGAVLTVTDIDADRRRLELARRINRHAVNVLGSFCGALLVLDAEHRVLWASRRYHEMFGTCDDETVGSLIHNLGNGQWAHPKLRAAVARTLAEGEAFEDFRIEHPFERVGELVVRLAGRRIQDEEGAPLAVVVIAGEADGERAP